MIANMPADYAANENAFLDIDLPGGKQKLYSFRDRPCVVCAPNQVPQVLCNGVWKPLYATWDFIHEAESLTPEQFQSMMSES